MNHVAVKWLMLLQSPTLRILANSPRCVGWFKRWRRICWPNCINVQNFIQVEGCWSKQHHYRWWWKRKNQTWFMENGKGHSETVIVIILSCYLWWQSASIVSFVSPTPFWCSYLWFQAMKFSCGLLTQNGMIMLNWKIVWLGTMGGNTFTRWGCSYFILVKTNAKSLRLEDIMATMLFDGLRQTWPFLGMLVLEHVV